MSVNKRQFYRALPCLLVVVRGNPGFAQPSAAKKPEKKFIHQHPRAWLSKVRSLIKKEKVEAGSVKIRKRCHGAHRSG